MQLSGDQLTLTVQKALPGFATILFSALGLYSWTSDFITHLAETEIPVYKSLVSSLAKKSYASYVNICKNPLLYTTQYICIFTVEGGAMGNSHLSV